MGASCAANDAGIAESLPRRPPKRARPHRYGAHFWLVDGAGAGALRRRPAAGLLGGMTELPGTPWREEPWRETEALAAAPMRASWRKLGEAQHGFTHFTLSLEAFAARVASIRAEGFPPARGGARG